jgi:hypothetical protein
LILHGVLAVTSINNLSVLRVYCTEETVKGKKTHQIALCGELALEEAFGLLYEKQQNE